MQEEKAEEDFKIGERTIQRQISGDERHHKVLWRVVKDKPTRLMALQFLALRDTDALCALLFPCMLWKFHGLFGKNYLPLQLKEL